jgi:hypothetical protein
MIISLGVCVLAVLPCLIPAGVAVYYERWHERKERSEDPDVEWEEFQETVEGQTRTRRQTVFDSALWTG